MNLIEAIKSGRPFRRKSNAKSGDVWWFIQDEMLTYEWGPDGHGMPPPGIDEENPALWSFVGQDSNYGFAQVHLPDLLADDWELRDLAVTITRSQFWRAVNEVATCPVGKAITLCSGDLHNLARKLGLVDPT